MTTNTTTVKKVKKKNGVPILTPKSEPSGKRSPRRLLQQLRISNVWVKLAHYEGTNKFLIIEQYVTTTRNDTPGFGPESILVERDNEEQATIDFIKRCHEVTGKLVAQLGA